MFQLILNGIESVYSASLHCIFFLGLILNGIESLNLKLSFLVDLIELILNGIESIFALQTRYFWLLVC